MPPVASSVAVTGWPAWALAGTTFAPRVSAGTSESVMEAAAIAGWFADWALITTDPAAATIGAVYRMPAVLPVTCMDPQSGVQAPPRLHRMGVTTAGP